MNYILITPSDISQLALGVAMMTACMVFVGHQLSHAINLWIDRRAWRADRRQFYADCAPIVYPSPGCSHCAHAWNEKTVGDPCPGCGEPLKDGNEAYADWYAEEFPKHFAPKQGAL